MYRTEDQRTDAEEDERRESFGRFAHVLVQISERTRECGIVLSGGRAFSESVVAYRQWQATRAG